MIYSGSARLFIGHPEHGISQPALEFGIVTVLFEQFGVVLHQSDDHARQRFVVLDAGILFVGVLLGVLIGLVGCDLFRNVSPRTAR